uniref:Uncharacterized protein n=1 Tax=Solanum lycopersicum TaxID=4081 RepID=A0A494G8W6_SOLLC
MLLCSYSSTNGRTLEQISSEGLDSLELKVHARYNQANTMAETKEEFEARIWAKYEAELQSKIEAMNAQEEFERKLRVKLEAEYAKKRRVIL